MLLRYENPLFEHDAIEGHVSINQLQCTPL